MSADRCRACGYLREARGHQLECLSRPQRPRRRIAEPAHAAELVKYSVYDVNYRYDPRAEALLRERALDRQQRYRDEAVAA